MTTASALASGSKDALALSRPRATRPFKVSEETSSM
jgi:hypothetical protein